MENVEEAQGVSPKKIETPEEVQQEAESSKKVSEEHPSEDEKPESEDKLSEPAESSDQASPDRTVEDSSETKGTEMKSEPAAEEETIQAESTPEEETSGSPKKAKKSAAKEEVAQKDSDELQNQEEAAEEESAADVVSEIPVEEEQASESESSEKAARSNAKTEKVGESSEEDESQKEAANQDKEQEKGEHEEEDHQELEEEDHQELEEEDLDFSKAGKEELLKKIKELSKEERIQRVDRVIKALKPRFDEIYDSERLSALNKFELEGNDPNAFEYHGDEIDKEFNSVYATLKSKRNRFYRDLESQKDDNLKRKQQLLERLRELVDGEESNASFNQVKEIQAEWKKVGPVPGAHNKTLWANYNALLDRFYDQRSIYFELKDLDRKKNLKIKQELCERAEALAEHQDLKSAIVQLNELHEEYKHAGSVPREEQEALWQRFKAASDTIYARRKDYFDNLKEEFEKNYEKKLELAKLAETFIGFDADGITDWNKKTKEIQEIQKQWEAIGGLPRDKAKAVNKQFWGSFKKFFNNKNQFFKKLEGARDENLQKKEELITQAEELKESSDWGATTQRYKDLQAKWKDIGPVPEKVRNEFYKKFKAACDHFFERRRAQNSEQEKQYEENLKLKLQICDQIEAIARKDEINLDDVYDLVDNHAQLGFVPRNAIKKERARFEEATEKILSLEDLEAGDKADLKNHIQLSRMKNSPGGERKVQRKEHSIKRKISELESDIDTWNTNMEFFAASATADKLKADLQQKINDAKGELESLKSLLGSMNE